jgi:hypothetical protein
MESQWYYANAGQKFGPITAAQLKWLAASRKLTPTDLVWKEGMASWVAAGNVQGLFVQGTAATPLPVARPASPVNPRRPVQPQQPVAPQPDPNDPLGFLDQISSPTPSDPAAQPGYGQPYNPAGYDPRAQPGPACGYAASRDSLRRPVGRSHRKDALNSLGLSILGIALILLCWFVRVTFKAVIFGGGCGIMGVALAAHTLSGMSRSRNGEGKGMAIAGLVVGIIAVVLLALGLLVQVSNL